MKAWAWERAGGILKERRWIGQENWERESKALYPSPVLEGG